MATPILILTRVTRGHPHSPFAVIYVLLIGSLMAIVLGAQATLRDRKESTADLVLSRPVGSASRLLEQEPMQNLRSTNWRSGVDPFRTHVTC